jgi:SAM-dependent methyltransferase
MRDPRAIVQHGYDAIARTYLENRLERISPDERAFLDRVLSAIPPASLVVELGCGAGVPFTAALADVATVVGVDVSAVQLQLARERVPRARLVRADMATLALRPRSVDAVVAFASIGHVPCRLHDGLYRSIASWLRPGGVFASQHPVGDNPEELDEDWMGAPMFFSHPDLDGSLALVRAAGLRVESLDEITVNEHDGTVTDWAGIVAHAPDH